MVIHTMIVTVSSVIMSAAAPHGVCGKPPNRAARIGESGKSPATTVVRGVVLAAVWRGFEGVCVPPIARAFFPWGLPWNDR